MAKNPDTNSAQGSLWELHDTPTDPANVGKVVLPGTVTPVESASGSSRQPDNAQQEADFDRQDNHSQTNAYTQRVGSEMQDPPPSGKQRRRWRPARGRRTAEYLRRADGPPPHIAEEVRKYKS